jgi:MYXO-CTERM domain-containing protein
VDPAAAVLYLAAVLVSALPWGSDRAGVLSAWSPSPDAWPLVSIALLAAAGLLALRRRRRRAAHMVAGGLAVLVGLIALPAPPFATRTVVPFLVVGLGAVGTGLAASRFLGRSREEHAQRP